MKELKLGKLPMRYDRRTIPLKSILKVLPPIPKEWDADSQFLFRLPTPMFLNNKFGDCVIAARGHLTFRFEGYEQKKAITISDKDVTEEYFKESGGIDSGLVMLDSLKQWRNEGWRVGGRKVACLRIKRQLYDIFGFAKLTEGHIEEVKQSIYFLNGCYGGFMLPQSAMEQFNASMRWEDIGDTDIVGGHCVTMCAYNEIGPIGLTWGKRQQITWKFYDRYADEAYGVVDNKDKFLVDSPVDVEKLTEYLKEVTA